MLKRILFLSLAVVVIAACAVLGATSHRNPGPSTKVVHVDIFPGAASYATGYDPDNITVVIGVNNTVIWTNNDNEPHTVTASDGAFDSGNMNAGSTFAYTFTNPGTYTYFCRYHPWMHGYVIVKLPVDSQQT